MILLHDYIKFFVFLSISMLGSSDTTEQIYNSHVCSNSSNNTANNDTFETNLNTLLGSLSSKAASTIFYNETSNQIYALFLCRGDVVSNTDCQNCVNVASQDIKQRCGSNKTAAIIWYDKCMLRYDSSNFFGTQQMYPKLLMWNTQNNSYPDGPDAGAKGLIWKLISEATELTHSWNYAAGNESGTESTGSKYGLVQCTRDIDRNKCKNCLGVLAEEIDDCCQGKKGWRILTPTCNVRYEEYAFFQLPVPAPAPAPAAQPVPDNGAGNGGKNTTKIVIITVSTFAVVAALLGFCFYSFFHRKSRKGERETSQEILLHNLEGPFSTNFMEGSMCARDQDNSGEMHYFRLSTIQAATNNFSDDNKLGEGGFGPVYKGKLLNGKEIAVKRLSMKSGQGLEEFKNEVMVIAKLQHRNLVRLFGCCVERDEKLLVYEYMANTSLDAFLFDPEKCNKLDWDKRANFVNGIAKGILYLHEDSRLKIIHRDLKASNVLLDDEMNPKISDFGTARIFGGKQIEANTNRIVGTYGYMAPEYAMEGLFSIKSDVYSFGVLMLEIISGKKNTGFYNPDHGQSLLSYAWKIWNEGKGQELIDQNLIDTCPISEALRWIHIALLCIQEDPNDRPTMSTVVLMLGSKSAELPKPSAPPFSVGRFFMSDQSSSSGIGTGFLTDQSSPNLSSQLTDGGFIVNL